MVLGMAIFAAMLAIMATVALTGLHAVFIFEDKIMSHFWQCTIFNSMLAELFCIVFASCFTLCSTFCVEPTCCEPTCCEANIFFPFVVQSMAEEVRPRRLGEEVGPQWW